MKKLGHCFKLFVVAVSMTCQPAWAVMPDIWLQSAGIGGAGDTITVTRVPVRDANGTIKYKIITIRFRVDANGNPTLAPGFPKVKAAPPLIPYTFISGTYKRSNGCKYTVSSPGVLPSGRTSWAITKSPHSTCNDTFDASWVTGPITGHPHQAKLKNAGITYSGYSWGNVGQSDYVSIGEFPFGWDAGYIIGAEQTGNQLTLHLFFSDNVEDSNAVFTLCPGSPASC